MIQKAIDKKGEIQKKQEHALEEVKPVSKNLDIREMMDQVTISDDPVSILKDAKKEIESSEIGVSSKSASWESTLCKAMSLFEFDKGVLMSSAVPERLRTFSIEFSRNLQKEYKCENPSEKATAELVAINFVRTLDIQTRINGYLGRGEITDMGVRYLAVLSKELDKANRHYLNSLQTLKMIKLPALEVNIKTQTAIVGQNQLIQANNK
jgi:hypothetical protein